MQKPVRVKMRPVVRAPESHSLVQASETFVLRRPRHNCVDPWREAQMAAQKKARIHAGFFFAAFVPRR